jgi:hypothetical protein
VSSSTVGCAIEYMLGSVLESGWCAYLEEYSQVDWE